MELIVINENKLKITLSRCDMKQYSLDCSKIDYDNTETRRAFWSILDEVKQKTGFDAASRKVFVQLYPSKEGGCEMYVTKLCGTEGSERGDDLPDCHRLHPLHRRTSVYSLPDISRMLAVCRRLRAAEFSDKSAAYADRGSGKYFLVLEEAEENAYLPLCETTFIREYGQSESPRSTLLYLHEHGECICAENAVDVLGQL